MSDDAFTDLQDNIWYQLACRCSKCGVELELSDLERIKDRDFIEWSRLVAKHATAAGWEPIQNEIGVICPTCAAKSSSGGA